VEIVLKDMYKNIYCIELNSKASLTGKYINELNKLALLSGKEIKKGLLLCAGGKIVDRLGESNF